ncbi:MAG TPA: hypothetical protein VGF36_01630 [Rhodopila sp.]|jgi:hypothetical protein
MELINWPMLREPINWIVVILMLAIAAFGLTLLQPALGQLSTGTAIAI